MNFLQSAKFQYNIRRILKIALFWSIGGLIDAFLLNLAGQGPFFAATERYIFWHHLLANGVSYFLVGLISGYLMVYWLRDRLRKVPFIINLLFTTFIMATVVICLSWVMYLLFYAWLIEKPMTDPLVLDYASTLFKSSFNLRNILFAFILAIISILFLGVNDKYGPGVFTNYIFGKYHQPQQEQRIFIFVDMKSSTTIAEQIGNIQFHNLLNDFFRDLTDSILYTRGQVYQYVGDEIIVSWEMRKGLKNYNCIRCYYAMQEAIEAKKQVYLSKYGLVPTFKAGLHCGEVTTGEIGVIKRDIVYSGDVLNTTARIQSMCNTLGVKILLSKKLSLLLHLPPALIREKEMGAIDLRGKKEKVVLITLEER